MKARGAGGAAKHLSQEGTLTELPWGLISAFGFSHSSPTTRLIKPKKGQTKKKIKIRSNK